MIGVEAAGCAPYVARSSTARSTRCRRRRRSPTASRSSVRARSPSPIIRELVDDVVTVTDAEIGQMIVHLLERDEDGRRGRRRGRRWRRCCRGKVTASRAVAVLSGGNIDTPLLMQVIRFGLTNQGRYLVIRTRLIDRPGALMNLLQVIADAHVNMLVVSHHRESVDVAVAETGIEVTMETRDEAHADQWSGWSATRATRSPGCNSRHRHTHARAAWHADSCEASVADRAHFGGQRPPVGGADGGLRDARAGRSRRSRSGRAAMPATIATAAPAASTSRPAVVSGCGSIRSACHHLAVGRISPVPAVGARRRGRRGAAGASGSGRSRRSRPR